MTKTPEVRLSIVMPAYREGRGCTREQWPRSVSP